MTRSADLEPLDGWCTHSHITQPNRSRPSRRTRGRASRGQTLHQGHALLSEVFRPTGRGWSEVGLEQMQYIHSYVCIRYISIYNVYSLTIETNDPKIKSQRFVFGPKHHPANKPSLILRFRFKSQRKGSNKRNQSPKSQSPTDKEDTQASHARDAS